MDDDLSPLAKALRHTLQYANREGIYQNDKWELLATAAREFLGGAKPAAKPAAPAERPTCATCPHWESVTSANGDGWGECLHAPRRHHKHNGDRCSQHPDFPAWIAARAEGGR